MQKIISASIFMMILSGCHTAPMMYRPIVSQNLSAQSVSMSDDAVKLVDGFTTVIDKQKVIQKLTASEIQVQKADIFDQKNVLIIEFSKGRSNSVVGFLRMYLRPTGVSEIQMVGNFYKNLPVVLSKQESAQLLKSATNYPQDANLDKILG